MKGIVFNLLEEVVIQEFGPDVWDDLLDEAQVGGAYTSLGNYPDTDMNALVAAAAAKLGKPPEDVLRWFGQQAMPLLAKRYPSLFVQHTNSRSFVLSVNSIIHPEVRKLYPGADCPFFHFTDTADDGLTIGYESSRDLLALAQGFIEGAAQVYQEEVEIKQLVCPHSGSFPSLRVEWT